MMQNFQIDMALQRVRSGESVLNAVFVNGIKDKIWYTIAMPLTQACESEEKHLFLPAKLRARVAFAREGHAGSSPSMRCNQSHLIVHMQTRIRPTEKFHKCRLPNRARCTNHPCLSHNRFYTVSD